MKRLLLLLGLTGTTSFSSAQSLQEQANKIQQEQQQASEGIALGRIKGSEINTAFAGATHEAGPAPNQHTLFEIGSITKVFTAILLAETVRTGKAQLSDPVGKYLPEAALGENSPLNDSVTLESLATHTSGLPRIPDNMTGKGFDPENPYAHYDRNLLYAYLNELQKDNLQSVGSHAYSNLGVGLLGHALELIWNTDLPNLMDEQIFTPLKMNDTFVALDFATLPAEVTQKLATGHQGGKPVPHWEINCQAGAGAIVSSVHDLLQFAKAHWDDNTPPGLAESLELVTKKRLKGQGLGWLISKNEVSHGGGTGGFRSHLAINIKKQTASVELKNSAGMSSGEEQIGDFTQITGFWQGTLALGLRKLRMVKYIDPSGRIVSFSIDQGCPAIYASKSVFEDNQLTISFPAVEGTYSGSFEVNQLRGHWKQAGKIPLTLVRSETAPDTLVKGLTKQYPNDLSSMVGYWSGYLGGNDGLFVYLKVDQIGDDLEIAAIYSPDQHPAPMHVNRLELNGNSVSLKVAAVNGTFNGELKEKMLQGVWNQGKDMPLTLRWSKTKPGR